MTYPKLLPSLYVRAFPAYQTKISVFFFYLESQQVLRPLLTSPAWSENLAVPSANFSGSPLPRACKRSPVVRRSTFRSTSTGVYKTGALVNGGFRLHVQTLPTPRHASNPVRVPYLAAFASALLSGSPHGATLGSN
jgi:hypothetical protein